ncbi:hypothetical protein TNCV_5133031 [Trichonephila clavipes]|nr:hypothetical protein TNCV_5133031 [Trichonephila clavipes]
MIHAYEIHKTGRPKGLHGPRRAQRDFGHRVAQTQAEQGFHGAQLPVLQKYVQKIFGRSAQLHRISHQFWHQVQFRNCHCGHDFQQDQHGAHERGVKTSHRQKDGIMWKDQGQICTISNPSFQA